MTNDALKALDKIQSDVDGLFPKHTHGERFETIRAALAKNGCCDIDPDRCAGMCEDAVEALDWDLLDKILIGMRTRNEEGQMYLTNWIADNKHFAARGCFGVPEGYVLVPIDLLHKAKVLINFHVKRGACIDINDKLFNEGEIYSELNKLWAQALAKDAPKKEGV